MEKNIIIETPMYVNVFLEKLWDIVYRKDSIMSKDDNADVLDIILRHAGFILVSNSEVSTLSILMEIYSIDIFLDVPINDSDGELVMLLEKAIRSLVLLIHSYELYGYNYTVLTYNPVYIKIAYDR